MVESSVYRVEIRTTDLERAVAFYAGAFDWKPTRTAEDYVSLDPGGGPVIGLMQIPGPHVPVGLCPYVTVPDCTVALETLQLFGGQVIIPPTPNEGEGIFAVGLDPSGTEIGMIQLNRGFTPPRPQAGTNPMVWMEVPYAKLGPGASFYQQMFGWEFLVNEAIPNTGFYKGEGRPVGVSIVADSGPQVVRGSTVYVGVPSVPEGRQTVESLGGQVSPATGTSPGEGAFTIFGDLDGLRMGMYQTASIH
jgi:predicted enzyme related to lactoylglutathione lyase